MASIYKRGKYYYITFFRELDDGTVQRPTKSLGIKYKHLAEDALEELEKLYEQNEIHPFSDGFNPQQILANLNNDVEVHTVREAADYFYKKKSHLSKKTVNLEADKFNDYGTYQKVIEHFIEFNGLEDAGIKEVKRIHFENIVFKQGIKSATRHFYFSHFRAWWNKLLEWEIVERNVLKNMERDIPDIQNNTIPKMIDHQELNQLFEAVDDHVSAKLENKHTPNFQIQYWFKPLISCYFFGGMRKHEVAYSSDLAYSGLKGENLKFIDDKLSMIYLPATKGRTERLIPVSKEWRGYMEEWFERRGIPEASEYVFIYINTHKDGKPVHGQTVYKNFKRYLKKAGLPKSRTLHGMRHERITNWLDDFNQAETQFMAGHTSSRTTKKYTHIRGNKLLQKQQEIDGRKD